MTTRANHEKKLAKGRTERQRRSSALRELSSRHVHIVDVLEDPPDVLGRCRIHDVLTHTPKLGIKGARKLCEELEIWPLAPLASVPPGRRAALIDALPQRVKAR